jgi:hypothetical protein
LRIPSGTSVAPQENFSFTFNVTAPTTPGYYNFRWRMVQDGVQWFGASTTNISINVGLNNAQFVHDEEQRRHHLEHRGPRPGGGPAPPRPNVAVQNGLDEARVRQAATMTTS